MPSKFDQNTVQQYGGVAWAKQQISMLDPNAIQDQITGYNQVKDSLHQIIDTLNGANTSLQASWDGDAAAAASQTFSDTSNHAQNVVTTVDNTITQLQTAKTAAATAKTAMQSVPNEVPVPNGGFFGGISNAISDVFSGTDPTKQAEQHNTAARTQAADVLNKLSGSYGTAANNMTSIAASGGTDSGFQGSSPQGGTFNLGSGSYGGGSGAAAGYTRTFANSASAVSTPESVGSVKGGVFTDNPSRSITQVAGLAPPTETVPVTPTPIGPNGPGGTTTAIAPIEPIVGNLGGGLTGPPNEADTLVPLTNENVPGTVDENLPGGLIRKNLLGGGVSEEGGPGGTSKLGSSSNVFGENGFGGETSGALPRGSSLGAGSLNGGEGESINGAASSAAAGGSVAATGEGQSSGSGMMPGMGARGGGGVLGDEELGSTKYSRGRFFGGEEPDAALGEWIRPAIGGNESLLVQDGNSTSGIGRVRSAYDGATDANGNPLHMMRGVAARSGHLDEDDERGERPGYLKEDPEWWQSAQKVAPPVVE